MTDTQVIRGIEFPCSVGSAGHVIYPYDDTRPNGTDHESKCILVRVRRKKGCVELIAVEGANFVRNMRRVDLPRLGTNTVASIAAATRFTIELSQALKQCVDAFASAEL